MDPQGEDLGFCSHCHPCPHFSENVRHLLEMVPTSIHCRVRLNSISFARRVVKGLEKSLRLLVCRFCNKHQSKITFSLGMRCCRDPCGCTQLVQDWFLLSRICALRCQGSLCQRFSTRHMSCGQARVLGSGNQGLHLALNHTEQNGLFKK